MIAKPSASVEWWKKAMDEVGIESMDKLIGENASWDEVLETGRADLAQAIKITAMTCGMDRSVVEIGCGVGRMAAALADHFGQVVGLDVSPSFIEEARRRNSNPRVSFEVSDGIHICPETIRGCDTVFSYEVFYVIDPESLLIYFQDIYKLLDSNGQFVFQLNMEPIHLTTRASFLWRKTLYACGIEKWHGWPTGPGLRRYYHSPEWLQQQLTKIGFHLDKIVGPSRKQKWVVAIKP